MSIFGLSQRKLLKLLDPFLKTKESGDMQIALAQINPIIGDLKGNTDKIISVIHAQGRLVDLIVFPELSICGYPPLDLVEMASFSVLADEQLRRVQQATKGIRAAVAVGHTSGDRASGGQKMRNSVSVFKGDELLHWYAKHLLPTYNIFDEGRHFTPGETNTPISFGGEKVAFLICEDIWNDKKDGATYNTNPVADAVRQGATMIVSLNASPSNVGKQIEREEMCRRICMKNGVKLVYVNQVGAQDDIVFDGNSFAMNAAGQMIVHAAAFEEDIVCYDTTHKTTTPHKILTDIEVIYNHAILGIRDYTRKCGFSSAVFGSSGGIDSAVVAALAVEALGKENVHAITMPSQYSSAGSVDDSVDLCRNLGIRLYNYPIKWLFDQFKSQFHSNIVKARTGLVNGWAGRDVTETETIGLEWENVQPRLRGMALMAFSNRYNALVLSTGNKSEMSVGYCTLYGDMCGGLAPISDIYKMEVYALARFINERAGREVIPQAIIDKEPSAELAPGQRDTDSLPPYPVLDAILRIYIEGNELGSESRRTTLALIDDYARGVGHESFFVMEEIKRKVDRAEFKRRQAPPTIRCHARAFGFGRRLPIAQKFEGI